MSFLSNLPIPSIPLPYKLLIAAAILAIACSTTGYFVHKYTADEYQLKIDAAVLAEASAKDKYDKLKAEVDTKIKDKADEVKKQFDTQVANITADRDAYKRKFLAGARLRDNQSGNSGSTKDNGVGSGNSPATSGSELSSETSGALFDLATDADSVAARLTACQAWAVTVTDAINGMQQNATKEKPATDKPQAPKKKSLF